MSAPRAARCAAARARRPRLAAALQPIPNYNIHVIHLCAQTLRKKHVKWTLYLTLKI